MANSVESPPNAALRLSTLEERLAVCRLDPRVICPEEHVPPVITCESGWRAYRFEGPFEFGLVGVLVREFRLGLATQALCGRGHEVR